MKNRLLNLLDANRDRGKGLRAEGDGDEVSIYVYDAIGGYFGIDAQEFAATLAGVSAQTIHLRINSPGGDVFDARSIQTLIAQHPAHVIAHIDGLAASAATFLMMVANEIRMSDGAFLMIHKGWTVMVGDADDFRETASMLDKVDGSIAATYAQKTGEDIGTLTEMMAAETWFDANEALAQGFVDAVDEISPAPANTYNLDAYDNTPAALLDPGADPELGAFRAERSKKIRSIQIPT